MLYLQGDALAWGAQELMIEVHQEAGDGLKIGVFVIIGVWSGSIACAFYIKVDGQNIAFHDFNSKIFI